MITVRVKLTFPESLVRTPVLARMVREFDVEPNIRRANVEEHSGGSFASWWATPATSTRPRRGYAPRGSGSTCSATCSKAEAETVRTHPRAQRCGSLGGICQPAEETRRGS